jgi:hypothetical protein
VVRRKDWLAIRIFLVPARLRRAVYSAPACPLSSTVGSLRCWLILAEIAPWLSIATKKEYLRTLVVHTCLARPSFGKKLDVVSKKILLTVRQDSREAVQTE